MALLTQEELNNIRSKVDIVDLVSNYIPLTQKGNNFFGVCPFHDDHSPSMSVSKSKQIYKCFSCGATGNAFNFVMDYEKISFIEAVKEVSIKAGVNIDLKITKNDNNINDDLYEMYDLAQKLYYNNIFTENGIKAKEYLIGRQITDEIIKEFGIGLSLEKNKILSSLLINKKYPEKRISESGLAKKTDYGFQDLYVNRIMFPLHNQTGKVVGFSGRAYTSDDSHKYINTMETPIFKKGELLYNYHKAKDECRLKKEVIIVEGFLDVITLYKAGIKNVVATMGTAVTPHQAASIKKLSQNVILLFDGDDAGAKATLLAGNELLQLNINPKVIRLAEKLDPDDFVKKYGYERIHKEIEYANNFMDFKLSYLKKDKNFKDTKDVADYVNKVIKEISLIDDDVLKELTLNKISKEVEIDVTILKNKLQQKPIKKNEVKEVIKFNKFEKAEQNLLFYMLKSTEVIKIYNKKITFMPTKKYRILAREISTFYKEFHAIELADVITYVYENNESLEAIKEITSLNLKEEYTIDEINDYINVIKEFNNLNEIKRLTDEIKKETDALKKAALVQKIIELKMEEN